MLYNTNQLQCDLKNFWFGSYDNPRHEMRKANLRWDFSGTRRFLDQKSLSIHDKL